MTIESYDHVAHVIDSGVWGIVATAHQGDTCRKLVKQLIDGGALQWRIDLSTPDKVRFRVTQTENVKRL